MAEKQFYVYKGTSIEGVDTSEFETNALITKKQFADNIQKNYAWEQKNNYTSDTQLIYDGEMTVTQTTLPDIDDYIEIVGGEVDTYVQTDTYSNGEQLECEFKIKMKGDTVLHKDEDYLITSSSDSFDVTSDTDPTSPYYEIITMYGTDAKNYYVHITGIGNYQDDITLEFTINKKSLSEATITQNNELVFSGGINDEHNPEFKIQFDNDWYFIVATNTTSNDFDVTFKSTTGHGYAGEHTNEITIKAKNDSNYTGSVQVSYFVNSAIPSISFVKNNTQVYDEYTPRYFKVNNSTVAGYLYYKIFDVETSHEIDITDESTYDDNPYIATGDNVSISNAYRINVGTYYIIATFVPNNSSSSFSDTPSYETVTGLEGTLTIKNEGDLVIVFTSDTNNYVYNGEPKTPNFRVECNGVTISSDNYTYSYDNNTNAGTATLTVTGKNNYNGKTAEETFIIKQAEPVCSITSNNITYGEGTTSAFTFKINNNLNGSLTYTIYDENGTTVDSDTINVENNDDIWETDNNTDAGTYHINASFRPADENYKYVSDINDELTIDKATPTLIVNNVNTEFDFNMHYLSVEPSVDGILKFNRINSSNNNIYTQGCTANNTQYLSQIQEFNNTVETYNGSLRINLEFTPNNTNYNTITTEGSINITPRNINQTISIWLYDDDWNEYTGATYIYDGNEKQPNIKIYISDIGNNGKTIELRSGSMTVTPATQDRGIIYRSNGVSYEVIYENNINANNNSTDPSVTVDISGNMYANPITTTFAINKADSALQISEIGDGKYDGTGSHLLQFFTKLSEYPSNLPGIIHYGYEEGNYNNNVSINANGVPATASACWIQNVSDSPKTIYIKFEPTNKNYTTIETTYDLTLEPRELDGTMFAYNLIGNQSTFTYDGTQKTPGVTVSVKQSTGASGTTTVTEDNYTIQYGENINAGKDAGSVTIIGKNNLSGSFTLNFTINKANLNCYFNVTDSNQMMYDSERSHTFDFQAYTFNDINPTYVGTGTLTYTITHNNIPSQFTEDVEHNFELNAWNGATNTGQYYINATFTPDNTNYNTCSDITGVFEITPRYRNLYISRVENNIDKKNTGNATMYLDDTLQLYVYAECVSDIYPQGYIIDVSGEQNLTVNVSDDNIISLDNLIVSADDIGTTIISAEYTIYGETHSHTFTINVQEVVDLIVSMDSNLTEIPQNDPELHFVYKGGYTGSGNVSSDCFELTDGNNEANIYVYELLEVSDGVSVSRIVGKNITAGTLCDDYDTIQIQGKYNGQSVMGGCWINANRTDQCWIISAESGGGFISEQNNTSPVGSGQFIVEYDTGSKILSSSSVDFTISNGR